MSQNQVYVLAALFAVALLVGLVAALSRTRRPNSQTRDGSDSPFDALVARGAKRDAEVRTGAAASPVVSPPRAIDTAWEPENANRAHSLDDGSPELRGAPTAPAAQIQATSRTAAGDRPPAAGLEARVATEVAAGRKIQGIQLVREVTGAGLKQAKDLVEQLARGDATGIRQLVAAMPPATTNPSAEAPLLSTGELHAQLTALLQQGHLIHAVKLLREQTNWSLERSKDAVDALRGGDPRALVELEAERAQPTLGIPGVSTGAALRNASTPRGIDDAVRQQLLALLHARQKIEAIKLVRECTGWGLKESKDYVDTLRG